MINLNNLKLTGLIVLIILQVAITQKPKQHHHHGFNYLKIGKDWTGTCSTGKEQSPINFQNIPSKCDKGIHIDFKPHDQAIPIIISDAHHSLGSNGNFSKLTAQTINGQTYNFRAINMHIHTPSEHQINGESFDMELHIVHTLTKEQPQGTTVKPKRDKAVVGILFQIDDNHPFKDQFFTHWDISNVKTQTQFDFNLKQALHGLLDRKSEFLAYEGSLTTPTCNEIVNWYVYTDPVPISTEQYQFMRSFFKNQQIFGTNGNNRIVQPLNGRIIKKSCPRTPTAAKQKQHPSSQPVTTTKKPKKAYNYLRKGADWPGMCATGREQSPIDFSNYSPQCDQNLVMEFTPSNQPLAITMNIGKHPITKRIHYSLASNNKFATLKATNIDGQVLEYQAMNMHMHSPSEHTVNGKNYDLELHLPHKLIDNTMKTKFGLTRDKAVVGIFFQVDDSNPKKDQFFSHWNPIHAQKRTEFVFNFEEALKGIFDRNGEYLFYDGSLTTPGCDEIATWYVFLDPLPISSKQLAFIRSFFTDPKIYVKGNNRITNPINHRVIKHGGCKGSKGKAGKSQPKATPTKKGGL